MVRYSFSCHILIHHFIDSKSILNVQVPRRSNIKVNSIAMSSNHARIRWSLHESTRRSLCRLTFFLSGALPLLATLLLVGLQFLPSYHQWQAHRWENWLQQQIGLQVGIREVKQLSPFHVRLRGVELGHLESSALRAGIPQVDLRMKATEYEIKLDHLITQARFLGEISRHLHDAFLCKLSSQSTPVTLSAEKLTLHGLDPNNTRFNAFTARVAPTPSCARVSIRFSDSGPTTVEPLNLELTRARADDQLVTEVRVRTGAAKLPGRLLAQFVPDIQVLGRDADYSGEAILQLHDSKWTLRMNNVTVEQLDLGTWTSNLATPITGRGHLILVDAVVDQRGIRSAKGAVRTENGKISQSLLSTANTYLGVYLMDEVRFASVPMQSYEILGIGFEISPAGLHFHGNVSQGIDADGKHLSVFMADQTGPQAFTSYPQPFPFDFVLATIDIAGGKVQTASVGGISLPVGIDAWRIAHWLPLADKSVNNAETVEQIRLSRIR